MNALIDQHLTDKRVSTVGNLINAVGAREPVYEAIANGEVIFDMQRDLVLDPRAPVYRDTLAWEADKALRLRPPVEVGKSGTICTQVGASLMYDGKKGRVLQVDLVSIWLKLVDGSLVSIEQEAVPGLVASGRLAVVPDDDGPSAPGHALVANASVESLTRALAWHSRLLPWITGESNEPLPDRTSRKRLQDFREAEAALGVGLAGLLDNIAKRGNRDSKLMPDVETEIGTFLEEEFGTPKAPNVASSLRLLNQHLRSKGLPALGRKSFVRRVNQLPPEELALKRYGHKVANAVRPPHEASGLPPAGDRAFQVAHIDSTQIDLELISDRTGAELPKAWITVVLNANPPMPLGWHIALHKANTVSVLMAIRDCVHRHNRLPDLMVYDLGSEHGSVSFDVLKATYRVDFVRRPRGNPRFGAVIESFFNTFNQYFIHQLDGNTK